MDEYNRDGPQGGASSWTGMIFGLVAGFVGGGLPFPLAAWICYTKGVNNPEVFILLFSITPLAALSGGIAGTWLAWKSLKRPSL